ncbi:trifunctional transcriptional regulator/proline dehydrogenase/pyrroline-5-carboxylate dehydrogenase [Escherichia coli]|uniref:Trifunctional transcriptional regulator/proline dehydrogenase/pyrroline-5-carboxylate dehydrogenase n=1 Tax=Escherichia coli TaxID=562 RepID=A0A377ASP6_ECOLX|nr:trifunctional transcriptional regulator/proline dehydrogenase/pyrroline-5-carboxylate dehydrogenase [Escherichia coli]
MGVKLDDATRERIKSAATRIDRTPHWLIKQAIFSYLEQLENSDTLPELPALLSGAANESDEAPTPAEEPHNHSSTLPSKFCPSPVFPRRDHSGLSPPGNRSGFYAAGTSPPAAASC